MVEVGHADQAQNVAEEVDDRHAQALVEGNENGMEMTTKSVLARYVCVVPSVTTVIGQGTKLTLLHA